MRKKGRQKREIKNSGNGEENKERRNGSKKGNQKGEISKEQIGEVMLHPL